MSIQEPDEGVVKYRCSHSLQSLNILPKELGDFFEVRSQLFDQHWIGETQEGIGFGNLSIRLSPHKFLITGTQTSQLPAITSEHLSIVSSWSIEDNSVSSYGQTEPSSEAITHGTLYDCYPDYSAIVHIHHNAFWSYVLDHYPRVISPYGTALLAQEILNKRQSLAKSQVFAMESHQDGVFVFSNSLYDCLNILLSVKSQANTF